MSYGGLHLLEGDGLSARNVQNALEVTQAPGDGLYDDLAILLDHEIHLVAWMQAKMLAHWFRYDGLAARADN